MAVSVRSAAPPWAYSSLIWNFAVRDTKSRFKGSVLGWAWSLIVPVTTVVIYSVVFSVFFRASPPPLADGRPGSYAIWLFAGLVVWSGFSNTLNQGIGTLLANGSLLQKIYFPSYAPVVGAVMATLLQSVIEVGILLVILLAMSDAGWTWALLLIWAPLFGLFVAAVTYTLAALNVYFRDLAYLVSVALQLFFFLTPVIYPITMVPETWNGIPVRAILELNPLAEFVESFRDLTYSLTAPALTSWLVLLGWTLAAMIASVVTYQRKGRDVGEAI